MKRLSKPTWMRCRWLLRARGGARTRACVPRSWGCSSAWPAPWPGPAAGAPPGGTTPRTGHWTVRCYMTSILIWFDIAPAGPGGSCGDHEDGGHQESLHPRHGARTRACSLTLTGHPSPRLAHGMQSLVVTPRSNQFICGDHQHFLLLCSESRGWLSRGGVTQCHETPGLWCGQLLWCCDLICWDCCHWSSHPGANWLLMCPHRTFVTQKYLMASKILFSSVGYLEWKYMMKYQA